MSVTMNHRFDIFIALTILKLYFDYSVKNNCSSSISLIHHVAANGVVQ